MATSTFWVKQPVSMREPGLEAGRVLLRQPEELGLSWCDIDVEDAGALAEAGALLDGHYVEDRDHRLRLLHPMPFLRWVLTAPVGRAAWAIGLRDASGSLAGLISAVGLTLDISGESREIVAVDLLCVHTDLRSQAVAPALIRELTRRVVASGIETALFTTAATIPVSSLATAGYRFRPLRPRTLVGSGYMQLPPRMSVEELERVHALPPREDHGFAPLTPADAPRAAAALEEGLARFALRPRWREADVLHWLIDGSGGGALSSWIGARGEVASFYRLPLRDLRSGVELSAAYLFYTAGGSPLHTIDFLLHEAAAAGCDLMLALDVMGREGVLVKRGFLRTDASLGYYLYDWQHGPLARAELAFLPF